MITELHVRFVRKPDLQSKTHYSADRVPFAVPARFILRLHGWRGLCCRLAAPRPPAALLFHDDNLIAPDERPEIEPAAEPAGDAVDDIGRHDQHDDPEDGVENDTPE